MNTTEQALLIILSSVLALFLILSVILVIQIMRAVRTVNRVSVKAESLINNVENVSEIFKQAAGPISVLRIANNIVQSVNKHKRG